MRKHSAKEEIRIQSSSNHSNLKEILTEEKVKNKVPCRQDNIALFLLRGTSVLNK